MKFKDIVDETLANIFTWTEPATLAYCCEVASKASFGVEIGTYMGASAYAMLRANDQVHAHEPIHLWCVDLFPVAGTEFVTRQNIAAWIDDGSCEIIVGDSARGGQMLSHMAGKLDFVWVDDGHATEDVKRDIKWFLPLLRSGGILFGHDFEIPYNDVAEGVLASLPKEKITFPVPRVWQYIKP